MSEVQNIDEKDLNTLINGNTAYRELIFKISHGLDKAGIYYRIFRRIKSAHSTAIKLTKKEDKYKNRKKGMQDIIGVRIVLYYYDDIPICKKILSNMFQLIPEDSEEDMPKAEDFSPIRRNYVFHLPNDMIDMFPQCLWEKYRIEKTFELQLRTIFSEGWYEVEHDVRFKHKEEWEGKEYYEYHRELSSINATLEICDHEIVRCLEDLAYDCYKMGKIQQMLRYKLRIHLDKEDISADLMDAMRHTDGFIKMIYQMDREEILCCISHPEMINLPKTMENIIFLCNELHIQNDGIKKLANPLLLNKLSRGIQAFKKYKENGINLSSGERQVEKT